MLISGTVAEPLDLSAFVVGFLAGLVGFPPFLQRLLPSFTLSATSSPVTAVAGVARTTGILSFTPGGCACFVASMRKGSGPHALSWHISDKGMARSRSTPIKP